MNVSYYENLISHLANRIWLNKELKRSAIQSVAEDVEYEEVSECVTQEERAEKAQIIRNNE